MLTFWHLLKHQRPAGVCPVLEQFGGLLRVLHDLLRRREHPLLHLGAAKRLRRVRVERSLRLGDRRLLHDRLHLPPPFNHDPFNARPKNVL